MMTIKKLRKQLEIIKKWVRMSRQANQFKLVNDVGLACMQTALEQITNYLEMQLDDKKGGE